MSRHTTLGRRTPRLTAIAGLAAAQLLWACIGSIGDHDGPDKNGPGPDGPETLAQSIGETTRVARLTHEQYDNTVRDLLEQPLTAPVYSTDFRTDASSGGYPFDNDTYVLSVDQGLHRSYELAAAQIALDFINDTALYDKWVPSAGSDEERVRGFVESFGERVHRRPLTPDQVDDYLALAPLGATTYEDTTGLQGSVRLILEALFTSPYFLYRTELSNEAAGTVGGLDGISKLTAYEIATRLSYTLWNTMPDDDLFAAAKSGALDDGDTLRAQVDRMLKDSRASALFAKVLSQAMGVYRYENIKPNATFYPDAPSDLSSLAIEELSLLMQDAYDNDRSYRELLTAPRTFVNQDTAPLYGLQGSYGPEFEEATLDASERRGLLTTIGFLASNSNSVNPDPIHRGLWVAQKLLCSSVAAPPGTIPPLPTPEPDQTNRQAIEALTQAPGTDCNVCHGSLINPLGFPFENFDAVGAIRDNDRGLELDLATVPLIENEEMPVDGALELIDGLAERQVVYDCYGQHLTSYLLGRPYRKEDQTLRNLIGKNAFEDSSLVDIIAEAVTSLQFTYRRLENP
ncbi:MAG: DUF1592 domain-containing protein [Polyangiaceae bacterium]